MPPLPIVNARQLITVLELAGFELVRQKGSHIRLKHQDGRVVTVPMHRGRDISRGLLRKVMREADISRDEFIKLLG